jgi:DNA mismatch repair ATPase MutS
MALRDDIRSGNSYYMAEIKSLKRILDMLKQEGAPVLCFVDEVLRGTNTVERIAASTQILRSLAKTKGICFAATHDIELTYLLKEYDNYHFEESIEENDITFSYKLFKGPSSTRNAIKLLQVMGYDDRIVKEAEKMAADFLEKGSWTC